LKAPPAKIDVAFLMQHPEIKEFRAGGRGGAKAEPTPDEAVGKESPEETMEIAATQHRQKIALELLQGVRICTDNAFEALVVGVLLKMGYGGSGADAGKVGRQDLRWRD
jgi:restriction system protein